MYSSVFLVADGNAKCKMRIILIIVSTFDMNGLLCYSGAGDYFNGSRTRIAFMSNL